MNVLSALLPGEEQIPCVTQTVLDTFPTLLSKETQLLSPTQSAGGLNSPSPREEKASVLVETHSGMEWRSGEWILS